MKCEWRIDGEEEGEWEREREKALCEMKWKDFKYDPQM